MPTPMPSMESLTQEAGRLFGATYDPPEHVWLAVQFSPSDREAGSRLGAAGSEVPAHPAAGS
jgi:hypothetical protein